MILDKTDTALVLAGLRLLQEECRTNLRRVERMEQIQEIDFERISLEYIDTLCEKINFDDEEHAVKLLRKLTDAVNHDMFTDAWEYNVRVRKALRIIGECNAFLSKSATPKSTPMDLIRLIANMKMDGEQIDDDETYRADGDDAISTMDDLISEARKIYDEQNRKP